MPTPITRRFSPATSLRAIRTEHPLIHQITNYVVMNETANITLAIGASPVMAHALAEVEEMAGYAGALVLNIGTLSPEWVDAMVLAGRAANRHGAPVVLDPVGAGATRMRTDACRRILAEVAVAIVRGNAAEVSALIGETAEIRGVDSVSAGDPGAPPSGPPVRYPGDPAPHRARPGPTVRTGVRSRPRGRCPGSDGRRRR